jgi:hypothetical protein
MEEELSVRDHSAGALADLGSKARMYRKNKSPGSKELRFGHSLSCENIPKVGSIRLQCRKSLRRSFSSHADSLAPECRGVARAQWLAVEVVLVQCIDVLAGDQRPANLSLVCSQKRLVSSCLLGWLGQSGSVVPEL